MKTLTVAVFVLFAAHVSAQSGLLAFNSEKKKARIENNLASLTREIENNVRYEAPKVVNEAAIEAIPATSLEDVNQLRNWLKASLEKEAMKCDLKTQGKTNLTLTIDKNGIVKEFCTDKSNPAFDAMLFSVMKKAPSIKPVSMNGYAGKLVVKLPISYNIEVL